MIHWSVRRANGRPAWHESERFCVRVLTGSSQRLDNVLEALKRTHPREGVAVYNALANLANALSQVDGTRCLPNVPEIAHWSLLTSAGRLSVVIVFGIVLNGARRGKLLLGDFYFCIVDECELEVVLDSVWGLEKLLTPETGAPVRLKRTPCPSR